MSKSLLTAFLLVFLVSGFAFACTAHFGKAQNGTNVTGIISLNTTWTKANSPYTLTGPTAVAAGVTLTFESGATVNLGNYYIQVNGTLVAIGSITDKIQISGGQINFTSVSNGWNEQTGSGNIIENVAFYSVEVSSSVALKMTGCSGVTRSVDNGLMITSAVTVNGSSIILENTLFSVSIAGGSAVISNNDLSNLNINGGSPLISNNTVGVISGSGGSPTISNNMIESIGGGYNNYEQASTYFGGNSAIISNNTITGNILLSGTSPVVSNNVIMGYIYGTNLLISDGYGAPNSSYAQGGLVDNNPIFAFSGNGGTPIITNNTLTGHQYNYTHQTFYGGLRGTTTDTLWTSGFVLDGNNLNLIISQNIISNCSIGILDGASGAGIIRDCSCDGIIISANPTLTIERSFINNGIVDNGGSSLTIRNNTINSGGIQLQKSATINFNNIQNYGQTSIYLTNTPNNVNATYNWWGTTEIQAINRTIHDFKNDFNLGVVTFTPVLVEPNPQALPNLNAPIPTPNPEPTLSSSPLPVQTPNASPSLSSSQNPTLSSQTWAQAIPETVLYVVITVLVITVAALSIAVAVLLRRKSHH